MYLNVRKCGKYHFDIFWTNDACDVKRKAMIRNWYSQISYLALKTKRERTKYTIRQQFTKGTRGKPNEQLFPRQVVIQLPKLN